MVKQGPAVAATEPGIIVLKILQDSSMRIQPTEHKGCPIAQFRSFFLPGDLVNTAQVIGTNPAFDRQTIESGNSFACGFSLTQTLLMPSEVRLVSDELASSIFPRDEPIECRPCSDELG